MRGAHGDYIEILGRTPLCSEGSSPDTSHLSMVAVRERELSLGFQLYYNKENPTIDSIPMLW